MDDVFVFISTPGSLVSLAPNVHCVPIPTRQDDCLRPEEISIEAGHDTGQDASAGTIQAFRRGFEKKKFQAKRLVCA